MPNTDVPPLYGACRSQSLHQLDCAPVNAEEYAVIDTDSNQWK